MRLAYCAITQPAPNMPIPAMTIETGVATPAPRPVADRPTISGSKVATENTGPMKPTDWARTPVMETLACPVEASRISLISTPGGLGKPIRECCSLFVHVVRILNSDVDAGMGGCQQVRAK